MVDAAPEIVEVHLCEVNVLVDDAQQLVEAVRALLLPECLHFGIYSFWFLVEQGTTAPVEIFGAVLPLSVDLLHQPFVLHLDRRLPQLRIHNRVFYEPAVLEIHRLTLTFALYLYPLFEFPELFSFGSGESVALH